MSSILIVGFSAHGHVAPLLAAAENFVKRGDDVRFITGALFADKVAASGATYIPVHPDADFDEQPLNERFPERAGLKGRKAIAFDIEQVFAKPAKPQYETIIAALAVRPADVVIADIASLGAAFLLGHPRPDRPPVIMCGVIPVALESRDTAPYGMGLMPARIGNRARNTLLTAISRRVLREGFAAIDAAHRQVHGIDMPFTFMDWGRHADAIAQFCVRSFDYPMSDAPRNLHFIGPLSPMCSQTPVPDWWSDLDGSRPVIHVTQGTIANSDYSQAIVPTLRALADEDVLVVISTGGRPVDTLPPLPANARAATFLPYDELLPRTSVLVTNGGYGGVQYALRYGVPIVATGGKEDKPEVGARVAWSGVGRRLKTEHPTPKAMRRNILAVLNDPRYRQASRRIAVDMAAAPGFAGLADIVDRLTGRPATAGAETAQH
ncbi:glycosyl transferase [Mycolicibacterium moriokaense]|uniref:Glycosyl transferase n=1 Tax=Mycolicibacterium moriokaense TaxID=39691 RepID=A0AAD1H9N4_9MYCO|nr:nucleotide disphospho-sugar-binding domain-containing protein [Mycolicibacterium moriokaense]MCV7041854.1 glycosyltransferase [Mycolicibacterium moriokaense]ORB20659.1 glycosyl transferase [Mycolicibacterium moriokaense]BBX01360.1 glycosyl transferase [Mycolicibacterium moriokaense]